MPIDTMAIQRPVAGLARPVCSSAKSRDRHIHRLFQFHFRASISFKQAFVRNQRLGLAKTNQKVPKNSAPSLFIPSSFASLIILPNGTELSRASAPASYAICLLLEHELEFYVHSQERGRPMASFTRVKARHKHVQLDQEKLDQAKQLLGAKTEREAIEQALDLVVSEAELNTLLAELKGKGNFKKLFR